MKCSNCGSQTHGGYCDCMIVNGEFKGKWWEENTGEIERLKIENEHLKEIISYVHCSNCGSEVGYRHKLIHNTLHCEDCYDYLIEKEKRKLNV